HLGDVPVVVVEGHEDGGVDTGVCHDIDQPFDGCLTVGRYQSVDRPRVVRGRGQEHVGVCVDDHRLPRIPGAATKIAAAARMTPPRIRSVSVDGSWRRVTERSTSASSVTPPSVPAMLPRPPSSDVPPTTTTVMADSSRPCPAVGDPTVARAASSTPAAAASA